MAAALVGSVGAVSTSASGGSVTPAFGTGESRTAGNLLVLWVTGHGTSTLISAPSGWSIGQRFPGGAGGVSVAVFFKIAAGSDAAPTVSAVTSTVLTAQLAEFSGTIPAGVVRDQPATATGVTTPKVATAAGVDAFPKELVIVCAATQYGPTHANTVGAHTLNNGATPTSTNNNAGNVANHYDFAYGITTGNGSADSDSYAFTTTNISDEANVLVSFKVAVVAASAVSETLTLGSSGVRKTFGASALAEVLTFVTTGVRKVLGSSALTETLTFVTSAVRKTFGASAISETFTFTTSGVRKTLGASALSETVTFTTAGTRTVYGASSMTSTFTATTAGTRTTFGSSSLDLMLAITTSSTVGHFGASQFALTDTLTTSGVRTTFGASNLAETLTFTTSGAHVIYGASAYDLTLTFTTASSSSFPAGTAGTITQTGRGDLAQTLAGFVTESGRGKIPRTGEGRLTKASHG